MLKEKLNSKFIFLILYFLIESKFIGNAIILPVGTFNEENYTIKSNSINNSTIIKNYYFNTIYASFEIGTPSQEVSLIINSQKLDYKIINFFNKTNNKLPYNFFNESNSKTYRTEGCKDIVILEDIETICKSNDTFTFYKDINIKKKNTINSLYFQLKKYIESDIPGEIGLGPFDKSLDEENNFFKILKNKNIINNYYFYFSFNYWNDTKGKLIIGDLPHIISPNKFSEDELVLTNIYIDSSTEIKWKFEFNNIYINKSYLHFKKVELVFDSDIIIGTLELESELGYSFFNNFTKDKNFFEDTFKPKENLYLTYRFYYFDISLKETLYKLIPSIKFESNELNYTFEITNDELFIMKGNYIYFKIIFPLTKQQDNFVLGRTFTLKYPFVFNPDLKQIGIYKKFINKKKNSNHSTLIKVIIIIIASILLIILGLKLGKYLYGVKRKRRANELDEDYEYTQSGNNDKDNDANKAGLIRDTNNNEDDINN